LYYADGFSPTKLKLSRSAFIKLTMYFVFVMI